jgi:hypothetical protein
MTDSLSELELELRLLPGVVNVGFGPPEPAGHVPITVVVLDPDADLRDAATRVARSFRGSASVEVLDLTPRPVEPSPPSLPDWPDERVALVECTLDGRDEARVVLAWQGRSATGVVTAAPPVGPVRATLAALEGLGVAVDADVTSISSGQGVADAPVRVVLRTVDGAELVGMARAGTEHESAARATLAAFNRYLRHRAPQHG